MSSTPKDRDERATARHEDEDHIDTEPLHPEKPAAGVDDVIETFDREPPEQPVTEADAPPPFG